MESEKTIDRVTLIAPQCLEDIRVDIPRLACVDTLHLDQALGEETDSMHEEVQRFRHAAVALELVAYFLHIGPSS